jgi:hypothetical protein
MVPGTAMRSQMISLKQFGRIAKIFPFAYALSLSFDISPASCVIKAARFSRKNTVLRILASKILLNTFESPTWDIHALMQPGLALGQFDGKPGALFAGERAKLRSV